MNNTFLHGLLLAVWYGVCAFGLRRSGFVRRSGIRPRVIQTLFALHVAAGLLHNAIAWRYFPGHGDIWVFFQRGLLDRRSISAVLDYGPFWKYYYTYITHDGIIYINMLLNALSFNDFSINTLLLSFPVFLGNIALFRVFRRQWPGDPVVAFSVFLLPSVLFWTSCIHREAVLYMLMGFLLFQLDRGLIAQFTGKRITIVLLCLLFIIFFRATFALALLPALACWLVPALPPHRRRRLLRVGLPILGLVIILISTLGDLPGRIAGWQAEFVGLEGHSRLPLPVLDGSWGSLLHTLPAAILNGLFEPLPGSGGRPIYLAFSLESIFIWVIVCAAIIRWLWKPTRASATGRQESTPAQTCPPTQATCSHIPPTPPQHTPIPPTEPPRPTIPPTEPPHPPIPPTNAPNSPHPPRDPLLSPFGLFCLVFSLGGMLGVGIMVPFAGALVRYRSVYLPFLLAPFLHSLCKQRFSSTLNRRFARLLNRL